MLTVLTWWWRQPNGRTKYEAVHVNIWADMVRRNLSLPHRIACVTAHPEGLDPSIEIIAPPGEFEDIVLPTWGERMPQCLRRIAMFSPDAGKIFGERFVSMDMDCVVRDSLDPLFNRNDDLVLYRGTSASRPYNGSMMLIKAGCRPQVYEQLTLENAIAAGREFLGSDQAWISKVLGRGEKVWGKEDGVYFCGRSSGAMARSPTNLRLLFFPGEPKPWDLVGRIDWIGKKYRRPSQGRALILGYSASVWDDVQAALESGPVDGVIASPEAAEHWPGKIDAVVLDDAEGERMAQILGFNETVFCGRSELAAV